MKVMIIGSLAIFILIYLSVSLFLTSLHQVVRYFKNRHTTKLFQSNNKLENLLFRFEDFFIIFCYCFMLVLSAVSTIYLIISFIEWLCNNFFK